MTGNGLGVAGGVELEVLRVVGLLLLLWIVLGHSGRCGRQKDGSKGKRDTSDGLNIAELVRTLRTSQCKISPLVGFRETCYE